MHLHLPHVPAALVVLSFVYATAIAVALVNPGRPTLGALVVLAGLTARWVAHRRTARTTDVAVVTPDAVPAPATAA